MDSYQKIQCSSGKFITRYMLTYDQNSKIYKNLVIV
jgi:hypothetical protein